MSEPALTLTGVTKAFPALGPRGLPGLLGHLRRAGGQAVAAGPTMNQRPVLQGVDVELSPGEIATVLGVPGAGKTCLLKIAAGLLRPTSGVVRTAGGSASLIDPRCRFHTAVTGRENVILRGVMDGLSASEARARCDTVARFAEINGLFELPVRAYPEPALARLAFSAMALLEARVLIWDDLLERCDPTFRQKCLALIPDLLREGKAILLATDDVGKMEEISPRAIWLDEGRVRMDGATRDVLGRYLEPRVTPAAADPPGTSTAPSRLAAVELLDEQGKPAHCYSPGDPITVAVELELKERVELPYFLVSIAGAFGPIAAASMFHDGHRPASIDGLYRIECTFERLFLAPRQCFTVRFALYAADGTTPLHPKRVIGSFVTGGSAAACGFHHEGAEGRILGAPPVLVDYRWRMPGGIEKAWSPPN
jgi:ABC-type polysaccharide/polyol phosphate transport system ATPase subunit